MSAGSALAPSPLGSIPELYGYEVPRERAHATLRQVFAGPVNFVDTSNQYGDGRSERRIGEVLRELGGLPLGFVLGTKVDPDAAGDFSGRRVHESVAESLERLGLERLQLLHLHDPERMRFEDAVARGGPVEALVRLREEGLVQSLGVAGGPIDLLRRYLATGVFDVVLTHNRYTLVDQTAEPLLEDASDRDVAVLNAAPFGGGMLARGARPGARYAYRPAEIELLDRVGAMESACADFGVPLAAAALQFSMRDARVASTVVGVSAPERVEQALQLAELPIPEELWTRLEPLTSPPD